LKNSFSIPLSSITLSAHTRHRGYVFPVHANAAGQINSMALNEKLIKAAQRQPACQLEITLKLSAPISTQP
jgi:hypothetical protein